MYFRNFSSFKRTHFEQQTFVCHYLLLLANNVNTKCRPSKLIFFPERSLRLPRGATFPAQIIFGFRLKVHFLVFAWNLNFSFHLTFLFWFPPKIFSAKILNFGFRLKFEVWFPPKICILVSACYSCLPPRIILISFRINMTVGNNLNATLTCQRTCFLGIVRIWK